VKVDLRVHEIPGHHEGFGGMQAALLNAKHGFARLRSIVLLWRGKDPERVNQSVVIELAVSDTGVMGVPQEIVHAVHTKGITGDDFREDRFPIGEIEILGLLLAEGKFDDVAGFEPRPQTAPDALHFVALDDRPGQLLVVPAIGQQGLLGRMGKRQVTDIVTEGRHAQDRPPVGQLGPVLDLWNLVSDGVRDMVRVGDDIEDLAGKLHHTQRVVETLVGCTRINEVRQRQLVDMAQPLEGTRVNNLPFIAVQSDISPEPSSIIS